MTTLRTLLFLTLFLTITQAQAGGYTQGNGGHVVVCNGSSPTPHFSGGLTLLDLYEGFSLYGFTYRHLSGLRNLSLPEAFEAAVTPYEEDPALSVHLPLFKQWFQQRDGEITFHSALPLWPGSFTHAPLKSGCRVEQAIVQYLPTRVGLDTSGRLDISKKFWADEPRKQSDLKVALLVHEYLYRRMWLNTPRCAQSHVRYLTAFFLSDQALGMTPARRLRIWESLHCVDHVAPGN